MQTILGAGGVIGKELSHALNNMGKEVRLVSRTPQGVTGKEELVAANLLDAYQTADAIKNSEVVYLTAGMPYKITVWQKGWPVIMQNVIDACLDQQTRLVFFDNIYMYRGDDLSNITEETPVDPPSHKGKVRAQIAGMLLKASEEKGLNALIARCADFYGPSIASNSILAETIIKPLSKNQAANIMGKPDCRHSFTFTKDAAKATAILGNTDVSYGRVWHLPTAKNPPTWKEWVELVAAVLGVKPKFRTVGKRMLSLMGFFMPVMKELKEMNYQNDRDYVFNSDKFEKEFNYTPVSYEEGLKEIIRTNFKK